ncbi:MULTISPECIES: AAA family ATPase [unclassified Nocardioides]|uniref:AAA family ATPase n=1 Tax=unclassified Nocardioides TaxID=2615069 RepID=UPI00070263C1|nr:MULTISPECIES: AAA family ATPase [unclassified Nocardioides]KRC53369.1 hypothetical protein ASE19_13540 [Nocardioides sp. Root79]KRC70706.1 hypothetical protein ASE20_12385 [Nocardioides sp. Root240]
MTKVWGIHNDQVPAAQLVAEGFVSLGWDDLGDLRDIGDNQEAMKAAVAATYPTTKPGAIPGLAGYLRRFAFEVAVGDLVVAPSKQKPAYNIGRIAGSYEFAAGAPVHRHRRPVEWLVTDAPRDAFTQTARYELGSAITFFQVANHAEEFEQAVVDGVPHVSEAASGNEQVRYALLQRTILEILRDRGLSARRVVVDELAERIDFTEFELVKTGSGIPRYEAAVNWGSVDMRAAGWIDKTNSGWVLTAAGQKVLDEADPESDLAKISSAAYRDAQAAKRADQGRFKAGSYPLIDAAVKLIGEGQWTTYSDIAQAVGTNPPSVGEYVHRVELDGHHRVVPVGQSPYRPELREALEAEGVEFDHRGLPDPRSRVSAEDLREEMDLLGLLPKVGKRGWLIRGSSVNGKDLVPTWREEGWISLAASNLREVSAGMSRDELKPIVDEDYAHASYHVKGEKLDEFHAFLTRMEPGHLIATVDQGRLYVGNLVGEARYQPSPEGDSNLVRDVDWVSDEGGVDYADLPAELATKLKVQRDVVDLTQQLDTLEGLLETETEQVPPPVYVKVELDAATPELAADLHVSQAWLQECIDLLNDRPQLIFYGPPGTGKTFLAQAIARHVAGDNFRLVQFHPAYSYEDFFEGYRPTASGGFELKPGPMRKIVDQALANPREPFVLIIDEINRGNLAKVFGELYFLLEYRKDNVELLYADEEFNLPENVFIIGTMNTADRSIALVDAAMRRRFAFLPLHPSEEPTDQILRSWLAEQGLPARVADLLDELNRRIEDSDFKIGPSYFMRPAVHASGGLDRTWRTSILPLLEEHHFGELTGAQVAARYGFKVVAAAIDAPVATLAEAADGTADPD